MARERKVFEATTADATDPIPFEIILRNGKGEENRVEFFAYGEAPANALLTLTRMARVTDRGVATVDASGMAEFMDYALLEDSAKRWREMVDSQEWHCPADIIGDVIAYIQEEWTGRPTEPSPSSSAGRRTTGINLTEPPSSTE